MDADWSSYWLGQSETTVGHSGLKEAHRVIADDNEVVYYLFQLWFTKIQDDNIFCDIFKSSMPSLIKV